MGKRKEMTRDFSSLTWFSKLKWLKCQPDMGTITARSLCKCVCMHVQSSPTLCDPMDYSPPLSTELSKQEYWSGLPVATPGVLPDPGIKAVSLVSPALPGRFFTTAPPGKPMSHSTKEEIAQTWSGPCLTKLWLCVKFKDEVIEKAWHFDPRLTAFPYGQIASESGISSWRCKGNLEP